MDAAERLAEEKHNEHWWEEAQEIGGANAWGRIHADDEFTRPGR